MRRSVYLLLLCLALPLAAADLNIVQQLLDNGDAEEALTLLEPHLRANSKDARALLQRSTAYFLLGRADAGKRDLDRSLSLDPQQRQAWLNKAGLEISQARWADAIKSLEKARTLDPEAVDNDLNIGAVRVLSGDLTGATESFRRYLAATNSAPESYLLVATNYAVAGYAGPAVEILRRGIAIDEKVRRMVRADTRFNDLESNPGFAQLLETDSYVPPPGSHRITHHFSVAYDGANGPLLRAVLDVLQRRKERFDSTVEVASQWALVWGRMRIKVRDDGEGGAIDLSAPPSAMTAEEFTQLANGLAREIEIQIVRLSSSATRHSRGG